jgi:hypothetical protein
MKRAIILGAILVTLTLTAPGIEVGPQNEPKSARDYYKELYNAGGLQEFSQYACFFDDTRFQDFFFTVVFSEEMVESLKSPDNRKYDFILAACARSIRRAATWPDPRPA